MIERIAGLVAQVIAAAGAEESREAVAQGWATIALVFDIAVKGLLIVAAAGLAAYLLRGASSAVRHFVWTLAAAALVALPVLALAMPRWQVEVAGMRRWMAPVRMEVESVPEALVVREARVAKQRQVIVIPRREAGSTIIVGVPDVVVHVPGVVIERPSAPTLPTPPAPPIPPTPPTPPTPPIYVQPARPMSAPRAWSHSADMARRAREEAARAAEAARQAIQEAQNAARDAAREARNAARDAAREAREAAREAAVRAQVRHLESERDDSIAAALLMGTGEVPSRSLAALPSPGPFGDGVPWGWLVLMLWLGGVAVVSSRVAMGAARVYVLGRRAWCIERGWPVPLLRRLSSELGIERRVKLLEGESTAMPLTWGVLRPVVLLPSSAAEWPAGRLETVLRHELAHIRRFDVLTQWIAEIACALHWFNPLVWLVAKRLRIEREMACDDDVLASGSPPAEYAADLVALARSLQPAPASHAAIAMARPTHLKDRVHALLDGERRRGGLRLTHAVAASVVAVTLVAPLAAMAPVPGDAGFEAVPEAVPAAIVDRAASDVNAVDSGSPRDGRRVGWDSSPHRGERGTGAVASPIVVDESLAELSVSVGQRIAELNAMGSVVPGVVLSPRRSVRAPSAPALVVPPRASMRPPSPRVFSVTPRATADAPARRGLSIGTRRDGATRQQSICWGRGDARNVHVRRNDDSYTLDWEADGCEVQIRIRGEVRFNADFTAVEWISPGGSMRLAEDAGSTERRLDIGTGPEGLEYAWRVDGREATFDAAASDWLNEMLLELFRSAGYAAGERSLWLLREHGVTGLLAEIEHLHGDHTRRVYYQAALEQGGLDAAGAAQLLDRAAGQIRSDHELSRLLLAAGERFDFDDAMRDAFLDASRTLQSDHERQRVLAAVLARGNIDAATAAALLESAADIRSDHEKASLLTSLGERYTLEPAIRSEFLRTAASIRSDHDKRRVLGTLMAQGSLDAESVAALLEVAATIRSDHDISTLLVDLASADLAQPALLSAYLRAASTIDSDHDHRRALASLLSTGRLPSDVVSMVLRSALEIRSDHDTAELLLLVLRTQQLDADRRAEFMRALETIESAHDHGRVSSALLRAAAGR